MTSNSLLKEQVIGQTIQRVTYFEINDLNYPISFDGFDNFDLGISIEFSNGFQWNCAWKGNDQPETGTEPYDPEHYYSAHLKADATEKWHAVSRAPVSDIEIEFIDEVLNRMAFLDIRFADGRQIKIIVGEELNADRSLPDPLEYEALGEFYVFYDQKAPDMTLIKTKTPLFDPNEIHPDSYHKWKPNTQSLVGVVIILLVLLISFLVMILQVKGELLFG